MHQLTPHQQVLSVSLYKERFGIYVFPAPTGAPEGLTHTLVDNTSITAMWDTVPCPHQRGPITGYKLFYSDGTDNVTVEIHGGNHRLHNINGLTPSTTYTIAVAAVNNGGTGPYSDPPLTVQTLMSTGTMIE